MKLYIVGFFEKKRFLILVGSVKGIGIGKVDLLCAFGERMVFPCGAFTGGKKKDGVAFAFFAEAVEVVYERKKSIVYRILCILSIPCYFVGADIQSFFIFRIQPFQRLSVIIVKRGEKYRKYGDSLLF